MYTHLVSTGAQVSWSKMSNNSCFMATLYNMCIKTNCMEFGKFEYHTSHIFLGTQCISGKIILHGQLKHDCWQLWQKKCICQRICKISTNRSTAKVFSDRKKLKILHALLFAKIQLGMGKKILKKVWHPLDIMPEDRRFPTLRCK